MRSPVVGPTYTNWPPFNAYHTKLGGTPGARLTTAPERLAGGRRARYQNGVLYERASGEIAYVYGEINKRYEQLGTSNSWLGFPIADEQGFDEQGGRVSYFERGAIYFWGDVGAIELNDVAVQYTGIMCFGETNEPTSDDEPYVILGAVDKFRATELRTQIYNNVDAGESVLDNIEVYRGKPTGLVLSVLLMEHDLGDPDKYLGTMQGAVAAGFTAVAGAIVVALPVTGPIIAIAAPAIKAGADEVGKFINGALGTGDDVLGQERIQLSAKQMIVLAARTPFSSFKGLGYKLESPLISSQGASYKVYFGLVTT